MRVTVVEGLQPPIQGLGPVAQQPVPLHVPALQVNRSVGFADEVFLAWEVTIEQGLRNAQLPGNLAGTTLETMFRKKVDGLLEDLFAPFGRR